MTAGAAATRRAPSDPARRAEMDASADATCELLRAHGVENVRVLGVDVARKRVSLSRRSVQ